MLAIGFWPAHRGTQTSTHTCTPYHTHIYTYTKNTERRDFIKSLLGFISSLKVLAWTTWLRVWHALVHPLTSEWDTVILPCFCGTQKDEAPCCESVTRLAGEELGLKPGLPQGFSVHRLIHFKGVFFRQEDWKSAPAISGLTVALWEYQGYHSRRATLSRSCFSNWKKKSWNQKSTPWE